MKSIRIDQDIYDYLLSKGMGSGETPSAILRRELTRTIEIDDDLYSQLTALAVIPGESISIILRREFDITSHQTENADTSNTTLVEFRIRPGTGTSAWNTREQTVVAFVGQTLRIINDDVVGHKLHTSGVPFQHGTADINPGQFGDFLLQAPFDPDTQRPLYDHNVGPTAEFWIKVRTAP